MYFTANSFVGSCCP